MRLLGTTPDNLINMKSSPEMLSKVSHRSRPLFSTHLDAWREQRVRGKSQSNPASCARASSPQRGQKGLRKYDISGGVLNGINDI